jgi:hypothetical protein
MRLYDQASGTPSQSLSSLDRKKWIPPKTFLPDPHHATAILMKQPTMQEPQNPDCAKVDEAVPSPSPPKMEEQKLMQTNFLFDIDEEISMNSSSTMSTHTSFHRDLHGGGRLGLQKPFPAPTGPKGNKIDTVHEENPFEVIHATPVKKNRVHQPLKLTDPLKDTSKIFPKGSDEISQVTRETELMTLTESSSEESPWLDFASEDFDCNPFDEKPNLTFPTQEAKRAVAKPSRVDGTIPGPSQDFSKYSAMMIRGHSVADVTKMMARDQVNPSIISLVMIAASENQQ